VAVVVGRWLLTKSSREHARNRQVAETLDVIRQATEQIHVRGINAPEIDLDPSFQKLEALAMNCPPRVLDNVQALKKVWHEVNGHLQKFRNESTTETMESSILTNRTSRMINEISRLANTIERQLGDGAGGV
jgi:hypothetical protein